MENSLNELATYLPVLPEVILVVGAMLVLMFGVFTNRPQATSPYWLTLLLLIVAGVCLTQIPGEEASLFNNSFKFDEFIRLMKFLTLIGAITVLFMSVDFLKSSKLLSFEFPVLVLLSTAGMLVMISAGDLIALYLGLELQSLCLYVIAAIKRDSVRSSEAGLKYFVLGSLSSGMLLYGASLIYGYTGSVEFAEISRTVAEVKIASGGLVGKELILIFGLVFLLAGLAFKISAVPFHMWTPDVYEGAPTPVTAFFAAAPKVAAMALLLRFLLEAFPATTSYWQQIVVFLSIASMGLGAFGAIGQRNIKRLMAYSSIGHMGFALVGLAPGSEVGVQSVIIYLAIYLVMTLGTFACILSMRRSDRMVEDIKELSGLAQNNLPVATALALLMFSMAGIPPLAGFFAKYFVFMAAIKAGLYPLAILGVLASVVAAFYYLRIVIIMFVEEPADTFEPIPAPLKLVMAISGVFVLCYVIFPSPLVAAAQTAAKALF